jgi:lipopolysaccharide/colanic/teichoic acid biosynthesis glycosyltransferase
MSTPTLTRQPVREDLSPPPRGYARWKRLLDVAFSSLGLALGLPVLALAALLVKLTSRGPALYSQVRLGLGGRPFRIYKLRSMYRDSEARTGPCWSKRGDARVTSVGRFLRRTHIDELPQLWNILRGDMSLIGPRPERPEMVPGLEQAIPHYRRRLAVPPGLTGLAQVQLPPDTDLDSVRVKVAHDLCYIERSGFLLDCRIILATSCVVVGMPYTITRQLFALPGGKDVELRYQPTPEAPALVPELQPV